MKYKLLIVAPLLLFTLNGCYGLPPTILPRECREFFELPSTERDSRLRTYPVDKQVDLYLCGMNREPPHMGYAVYIAEGGDKNIPYLLERLKAEPLEITQMQIIDIFTLLSIKGYLRGRQDVVAQLEQVVSKMKYEPVKLEAQRYVDEIRRKI